MKTYTDKSHITEIKSKCCRTQQQHNKTASVIRQNGFLRVAISILKKPWKSNPEYNHKKKYNSTKARNKNKPVVEIKPVKWKRLKKEDK